MKGSAYRWLSAVFDEVNNLDPHLLGEAILAVEKKEAGE